MENVFDDNDIVYRQVISTIENHNIESILASIRAGESLITKRYNRGYIRNGTLLHLHYDDIELIKTLLDLGCDINAVNDRGETVLHLASDLGSIEIIKLLLKRGADLNILSHYNLSPLHNAAYSSDIDICILLLENGANLMQEGEPSVLDLYGKSFLLDCDIYFDEIEQEIEKEKERMRIVFANGPHPSQIQRRANERWIPRWPFMNAMSGSRIIPLLSRQEQQVSEYGKIPDEILDTKEKKWMNLLKKVLGDKNLARIVVSFL